MKFSRIIFLGLASVMMFSCVSSKKLKSCEKNYAQLDSIYRAMQADYAKCREKHAADEATIESLKNLATNYKSNNTEILGQMKDLSILSGAQAESIKKSLD